jgi:signal transduction histidine kinase
MTMPLPMAPRVLVVDDEVELMSVLCEMLSEHGYDTVGCASAEAALGVLRDREIDLLITDLMMPGMDGITLLRLAQEIHPYLLGIVATGQGTIQTAVDAMKSGAFDYVLKPFKLSALLPTLIRATEVGRLRRDNVQLREAVTVSELNQAVARAEAEGERRARVIAEEALAIREEFLAVAAHELKTPITSLLGAVQLLIRQQDRHLDLAPGQLHRSMQIVERQASKLSRLVTQLLESSRLDAGQFVTQRSVVDLTALISVVVEQARATTDRHEIVLAAPDVVSAYVDDIRIEQVVGNLLDNAIKFSPDGGRIDVELSIAPDGMGRLAVRDHGIGIPQPRRANLFSRYYQAHAESHRSGLGMGLYISRRIVEHHGGRIEVEFPADAGSRFVVHLPTGATGANGRMFKGQRRDVG